MTNRRRFLLRLGALGIAAGIGARRAEARQQLRLTRHRSTALIDPGASPLLVVQLTDLHVGIATPDHLLERAVEEARRARPDLTVLTGDYLNRSLHHLERLRALVRELPRPCLATLGNHDHWSGAMEIRRLLEREGIAVLSNASTLITLRGRALRVVGVDDGMTGHADVRRALSGVANPGRALCLAHHPKDADTIARLGGRLILSGHTHGGQVAIPGLTSGLARLGGHRYLSGWYDVNGARLYVSPGIGSAAIPLRLGRRAAPEIALHELV